MPTPHRSAFVVTLDGASRQARETSLSAEMVTRTMVVVIKESVLRVHLSRLAETPSSPRGMELSIIKRRNFL